MTKIKLSHLYNSELVSGILLMLSFLLAVMVANVEAWSELYQAFVFHVITFGVGEMIYKAPLIQIVNDGLMTLFFLLIGLELKFHLVRGEFQEKRLLILPCAAAVGGVVVPVLFYLYFNKNAPDTIDGWAIPIATDTAFMLGILSFFGNFISSKLRAFIIGFSLIDDAIALLILALFYSKAASIMAFMISIALIAILVCMNLWRVTSSFYYLCVGLFLWVAMVESGIHGTLCGVVLALAIPVTKGEHLNPSLHGLENILRPLVYFVILPLFAFINSGVSFEIFARDILYTPLALGIISGLFLGKQIGIFIFSYIAVQLRCCSLPENVSWITFYAIGVLGGIGFTLSLFIGDLTFEAHAPNYIMRVSVIIASLLSAVFGVMLLIYAKKQKYQ